MVCCFTLAILFSLRFRSDHTQAAWFSTYRYCGSSQKSITCFDVPYSPLSSIWYRYGATHLGDKTMTLYCLFSMLCLCLVRRNALFLPGEQFAFIVAPLSQIEFLFVQLTSQLTFRLFCRTSLNQYQKFRNYFQNFNICLQQK